MFFGYYNISPTILKCSHFGEMKHGAQKDWVGELIGTCCRLHPLLFQWGQIVWRQQLREERKETEAAQFHLPSRACYLWATHCSRRWGSEVPTPRPPLPFPESVWHHENCTKPLLRVEKWMIKAKKRNLSWWDVEADHGGKGKLFIVKSEKRKKLGEGESCTKLLSNNLLKNYLQKIWQENEFGGRGVFTKVISEMLLEVCKHSWR